MLEHPSNKSSGMFRSGGRFINEAVSISGPFFFLAIYVIFLSTVTLLRPAPLVVPLIKKGYNLDRIIRVRELSLIEEL